MALERKVEKRVKSRKNKQQKSLEDAVVQGMALALAEVHRFTGRCSAVCEVASAAGLTVAKMRAAGVDSYDWLRLKKAGVP